MRPRWIKKIITSCIKCYFHGAWTVWIMHFHRQWYLSLQWFYQEAERSEFIKLVINMTYVSASLSVSFADIFWFKLKKCWTIGSTIYLFTYWFMLLLDLVIGADLKAPWFMVLYVIIIGTHLICPFVVYIFYIFLPTRCHLYFRLLRSRLFCLCNVKSNLSSALLYFVVRRMDLVALIK